EAKGFLLPVREASLRYRRPSRYDDLLYTRCAVSELSRASLTFVYGIYAEDREELRVTGFTQHALTDRQGRPVRMPDWLKDCVARVPDGEVVLV
ncbi:MAG: thioesterase family protein, partial [Desulfovibrio sp.]|nr:thioesterase family protein [Desulfovibrio sp.]